MGQELETVVQIFCYKTLNSLRCLKIVHSPLRLPCLVTTMAEDEEREPWEIGGLVYPHFGAGRSNLHTYWTDSDTHWILRFFFSPQFRLARSTFD